MPEKSTSVPEQDVASKETSPVPTPARPGDAVRQIIEEWQVLVATSGKSTR